MSDTSQPLRVIKRTGDVMPFDPDKIAVAMRKAFIAVEGDDAGASARVRDFVGRAAEAIGAAFRRRLPEGGTLHIEDIQDQVELALMRAGEQKVARAYVLYRERHAQARAARVETARPHPTLNVTGSDGSCTPLDLGRLETLVADACRGLEDAEPRGILDDVLKSLYDGVSAQEVGTALVMAARTRIEVDPVYSRVAARLLLDAMRGETLSFVEHPVTVGTQAEMAESYPDYFAACLRAGVEHELLDPRLLEYDLSRLGRALEPERDLAFTYLGLQTLYDRYVLHHGETRFELPQAFFMRVAMGLAIHEEDREGRAIEFYRLLSSFDFMSSTPTLFNSGTLRPQLSSCYLTTVPDRLDGIYGAFRDNALLSKFAGGLGNDWTRVRALGSHIKGTNGSSQGVVPFLKVANDTAVAVNQGGKRKGAVCAYLETWHLDIEEFLDLRKNTGDDRRRTHDMNTAHWVPDLFMKRVAEQADWTLFSPSDVPDLHDLAGVAFERAYEAYEAMADRGEITHFRRLPAVTLWRRMLSMLFETGHPWITFKDPCNLRYTNQHEGVVHSSNLCTEITLHTSDDEIAVCNLGSVNLARHVGEDGIDRERLAATVRTAMRMLDNVIEYNYYSVPQARDSNLRHRPVGLGIMGFQDALYRQRLAYGSDAAVTFADRAMEAVSYHAIEASSDLAAERGRYPSYEGSLWSQGVLPIDSIERLAESRGDYLDMNREQTLDWKALRRKVKRQGMRNSNTMAIAPTATISNICGVSQSIEPTFENLFVKSNLSGEFTVVNPYLVQDLKALGLWDAVMVNDLKYFDGSVHAIDRVPDDLKALYATAFEIDPRWLIEAGSRRQKWLDQAQSLNLYMAEPSGPKIDNMYKLAWVRGLKTTYYLRAAASTRVEKTTLDRLDGKLRGVPAAPAACSLDDPDCEACQ